VLTELKLGEVILTASPVDKNHETRDGYYELATAPAPHEDVMAANLDSINGRDTLPQLSPPTDRLSLDSQTDVEPGVRNYLPVSSNDAQNESGVYLVSLSIFFVYNN